MTNDEIKQMRIDMGLQQQELAKILGITKAQMNYLENKSVLDKIRKGGNIHKRIEKLLELHDEYMGKKTERKLYYIEFKLDNDTFTTIQRATSVERAKKLFELNEMNYDKYKIVGVLK